MGLTVQESQSSARAHRANGKGAIVVDAVVAELQLGEAAALHLAESPRDDHGAVLAEVVAPRVQVLRGTARRQAEVLGRCGCWLAWQGLAAVAARRQLAADAAAPASASPRTAMRHGMLTTQAHNALDAVPAVLSSDA